MPGWSGLGLETARRLGSAPGVLGFGGGFGPFRCSARWGSRVRPRKALARVLSATGGGDESPSRRELG